MATPISRSYVLGDLTIDSAARREEMPGSPAAPSKYTLLAELARRIGLKLDDDANNPRQHPHRASGPLPPGSGGT